jgi:Sulfotransferase domain
MTTCSAATGNVMKIAKPSMPEVIHRLPDFIIAGAPRSGTSWLYALARRHPQLAMAEPMAPEPKFFLVDELWHRGIDYYSTKWFDPLPAGRALGEKSTNYLESPHAAARICRALPKVKLIFLLRNPVDRAYSNYLWSRQNGLESETFERAVALEEQRDRDLAPDFRYARPHAYFSRGLYADLLIRFYNRFPREQILVLRYEDLETCPQRVAANFHRFLGVSEMPALANGLGPINAAKPSSPEPLPQFLRRRLAERYRSANAKLKILLGGNFDNWNDD